MLEIRYILVRIRIWMCIPPGKILGTTLPVADPDGVTGGSRYRSQKLYHRTLLITNYLNNLIFLYFRLPSADGVLLEDLAQEWASRTR